MAEHKIPEWGLREDGSLGNTMVPKLYLVQEHLAKLASDRYQKILELEREKLELSGRIASLEAKLKEISKPVSEHECVIALGGIAENEVVTAATVCNAIIAARRK